MQSDTELAFIMELSVGKQQAIGRHPHQPRHRSVVLILARCRLFWAAKQLSVTEGGCAGCHNRGRLRIAKCYYHKCVTESFYAGIVAGVSSFAPDP
jgi:hypothetical protein